MSYQQKIETVKFSLTNRILQEVTKRYDSHNDFKTWDYAPIKESYLSIFKEKFPESIDRELEIRFWVFGENTGFVIQTFIHIFPNYTFSELLSFVKTFLSKQMADF